MTNPTPAELAAEPSGWTIIGPNGERFTGESPLRAASAANRHRVQTDPVAAKHFHDAIASLQAESDAENERLMALHGTLNCPTCGGSGHIGDVKDVEAARAAQAGSDHEREAYAIGYHLDKMRAMGLADGAVSKWAYDRRGQALDEARAEADKLRAELAAAQAGSGQADAEALRAWADKLDPFTRKEAPDNLTLTVVAQHLRASLATPPAQAKPMATARRGPHVTRDGFHIEWHRELPMGESKLYLAPPVQADQAAELPDLPTKTQLGGGVIRNDQLVLSFSTFEKAARFEAWLLDQYMGRAAAAIGSADGKETT